MYVVITVLIILVCILLGLAVLIQNPKGSGLGAGFGGVGNQVMGARRATEFIEKATWTLVVLLLCLSLLSAMFIPSDLGVTEEAPASEIEDMIENNTTLPSVGDFPPAEETTPVQPEN